MHDPDTLLWSIAIPYWKTTVFGKDGHAWVYWKKIGLVDIWHHDHRGDDGYCRRARTKITKRLDESLKWMAHSEAEYPWFLTYRCKTIPDPVAAEALMRGIIINVLRMMRKTVSADKISLWAMELVHCEFDNLRSKLCHLHGYHDNLPDDASDERKKRALEQHAHETYQCVARFILRQRWNYWMSDTRFHVHHMFFRFPLLRDIKRWLFQRCPRCNARLGFSNVHTVAGWDSDNVVSCSRCPDMGVSTDGASKLSPGTQALMSGDTVSKQFDQLDAETGPKAP